MSRRLRLPVLGAPDSGCSVDRLFTFGMALQCTFHKTEGRLAAAFGFVCVAWSSLLSRRATPACGRSR